MRFMPFLLILLLASCTADKVYIVKSVSEASKDYHEYVLMAPSDSTQDSMVYSKRVVAVGDTFYPEKVNPKVELWLEVIGLFLELLEGILGD